MSDVRKQKGCFFANTSV